MSGEKEKNQSEKVYRPEDWDFQVAQANHFPGYGWEFHSAMMTNGNAYILWRIARSAAQRDPNYKPVMKLPNSG